MKTGNPLTGRSRKRMKYAALRQEKDRQAPEEALVSPETEKLHIPDGLVLQQREVCHQRNDERPMLRDRDGRVLAAVEVWRPFDAPN